MVLTFPKWFLVWHVAASVIVMLGLVGALLWSASGDWIAALSYVLVMSVLMLPMPLTYLFKQARAA